MYLKTFILLLILFSSTSYCQVQPNNMITSLAPTSISKGNIYAVIIGISDYKHDSIPKLRFAHKDANAFYDFLTSAAGGSVPVENIKILTNEKATVSEIYIAKRWLETTAKKDDVVFFYFAGHGDVENSSFYKLGFLLAYDTPYQNYFNNAIRIEDLNIMANTLSINKDVNVFLITDACHSGKLAGSDNRGKSLAGDQLTKVEAKEIRMASCQAHEEAEESEKWGCGRGAFSYYFVNGLYGLADGNEDGIVTFQEIKNYIDNNVPQSVKKQIEKEQNPVLTGTALNTKLAIVNDSILAKYNEVLKNDTLDCSEKTKSVARSLNRSKSGAFKMSMDNFFDQVASTNKSIQMEKNDSMVELRQMLPADIAQYFLRKYNGQKDSILNTSLSKNDDNLISFNERLASAMHNRAQEVINKYLAGDEEEMQKRLYYNHLTSGYKDFPVFLDVALKLVDENHPLYKIIAIKRHYFQGLAYAQKANNANNTKRLEAITELKEAHKLDNQAAYILNELGNLYLKNDDKENADNFLRKATQLAPTWSTAWASLSSYFAEIGKPDKGIEAGRNAIKLNKNNQVAYLHLGKNYELKGNLLKAKECYNQNLNLNTKAFFPYERLANIQFKLMDYKGADSLYKESEKRKKSSSTITLNDLQSPTKNDTMGANLSISSSAPKNQLDEIYAYQLAGDTLKVDSLLTIYKPTKPAEISGVHKAKALRHMLANQPSLALPYLQQALTASHKNNQLDYALARCHAMMGNKDKAASALLDAIDHGFNYGWVYRRDNVFDRYRASWGTIIIKPDNSF